MREDLNKILCEHERYNSDDKYRNYRNLKAFNGRAGEEGENLPTRESMKKRYGWNTKSFGENLNALYGLVHKNVGKPWDTFYSNLCKIFDKRSVINQHILTHLDDYVSRDVYVGKDGHLFVKTNYSADQLLKDSAVDYYVHPRTGIISRNPHYKSYRAIRKERLEQEKAEKLKVERWLDENTVLRFIEGVWYEFELKPIPEGQVVYEKPWGVDLFNQIWWKKEKTWDELDENEKKRWGRAVVKGGFAIDVYTGNKVTKSKSGSFSISYRDSVTNALFKDKYHATKKTASHKSLKRAGIIK